MNKCNYLDKELIKYTILGVEIKLPEEEKKYINNFINEFKKLNFQEKSVEFQIIKNALEIAKKTGTIESNNYFENKINYTRKSCRTIFAHVLESATIATKIISESNKISNTDKASLIASTLIHDSIEDSNGQYTFRNLKKDLKENLSEQNIDNIINSIIKILVKLTFSQKEQEKDKKGKNNQKKYITNKKLDNINLEQDLVYFGLIDAILKLFPRNNSKQIKQTNIYKKIKKLENEYTLNFLNFSNILKNKKEITKIDKSYRELNNIEKKLKEKFDGLLNLRINSLRIIKKEQIDNISFYAIIVRLSETITALGIDDLEGFGEGDYGIRNLIAKETFYKTLIEFLKGKIGKKLGKKSYNQLNHIYKFYLAFAKYHINFNINETKNKIQNTLKH